METNIAYIIDILQKASVAIVGKFDLDHLLQRVVESYKDISKASTCAIFLIDEKKNKLIMKASVGYKENLVDEAEYDLNVDPTAKQIGLTAWIALTKKRYSATNRTELSTHPAWKGKFEKQQFTGDTKPYSFIGVPLISSDKVVGVLRADNRIPTDEHPEEYFTTEEQQCFEILANTAAVAIENAKLMEEQRRNQSIRIISSIHQISEPVIGNYQLDDVLQKIVDIFKKISNATSCSIFLIDDDRKTLRMRKWVGYELSDSDKEMTYPLDVDVDQKGIGLTAWIVLSKQKFSAKSRDELKKHPAWIGKYASKQYKGKNGCNTFVGMPLFIGSEVIGVIKAENKKTDGVHPEDYFTEEEEQLLEVLSNIAAFIVENAALITQEEKQRIDRLMNLYKIGFILLDQNDINRLMYFFLAGLTHSQVIGFKRCVCFEYIPIMRRMVGRMAMESLPRKEENQLFNEDEIISKSTISNFTNRLTLNTELNKLTMNSTLDIDKDDPCIDMFDTHMSSFDIFKLSDFSTPIQKLLKKLNGIEFVLIVLFVSSDKIYFIFCDNLMEKVLMDQRSKECLTIFIDQMKKAFQRIRSAEAVQAAREEGWREISAMTAHKLGNILPFTESRFRDAIETCKLEKCNDVVELFKKCLDDIVIAGNIINDFKALNKPANLKQSQKYKLHDIIDRLLFVIRTDFEDVIVIPTYENVKHINGKIDVDFEAFRISLINLFSNSKEANPNNPTVEINFDFPSNFEIENNGLLPEGTYIKIIYSDNGPGITKNDEEKIFEPFYSKKKRGSGLGLQIIRRNVEKMGGRIYAESGFSGGAKFNIILPFWLNYNN